MVTQSSEQIEKEKECQTILSYLIAEQQLLGEFSW